MRPVGLRRRVVLGAAAVSGLAAVVLVVVVQLVLELTATQSVDRVLADRATATGRPHQSALVSQSGRRQSSPGE